MLNPADVSEIVELGLYGFALSRFSGCWIGLKVTQETADATQSFELLPQEMRIVTPVFDMPPGGLNIRWPDPPNDQEYRSSGTSCARRSPSHARTVSTAR